MRPAFLLIALALLVAGCTTPAAQEAVEPADVAPSPEGSPAAPTPSPTPPSPSPTPASPAPTPAQPAPAVPPAPVPVAWNLTTDVRLGWVAGAGAGDGTVPAQGQTDASRCPDATFVVPEGAKELVLVILGQAANPAGPGAGQYTIHVTSPTGELVLLEPAMDAAASQGATNLEHRVSAPGPGEWKLRAEPRGPVVQQVWTVSVTVQGVSPAPPPGIAVAQACGA